MADLDSSSDAEAVIGHLEARSDANSVSGMARFGIVTDRALGISNPDLRKIARVIGENHHRAHSLWSSGIREARLLALFTFEPKKLTQAEAIALAEDFASWEIVDAAADLFVEARLEKDLIPYFAQDPREFVRRAAFAMIASLAVHLKKEPDTAILAWLPLISEHAGDDRNFVKKAVNWALRNIGKRNMACYAPALELARRLARSPDRAARFIGTDAVRELSDPKVIARIEAKRPKA